MEEHVGHNLPNGESRDYLGRHQEEIPEESAFPSVCQNKRQNEDGGIGNEQPFQTDRETIGRNVPPRIRARTIGHRTRANLSTRISELALWVARGNAHSCNRLSPHGPEATAYILLVLTYAKGDTFTRNWRRPKFQRQENIFQFR